METGPLEFTVARNPRPATDEQRTTADRMAASVADADLRAQVREAVLLSLQRSS